MGKKKFKDPFAKREAQKYDNPAPSREFLLNLIEEAGTPLSHRHICRSLELDDDQTEAVRRRLRAMVRDGQLAQVSKGRYTLLANLEHVKGYVLAHRDGFGFVVPHDGSDDIFLPYRQMRKVFDGDEVDAHITHIDSNGRREGRIDKVIQHNTKTVVGRLEKRPGHFILVADNPRITQEVIVQEKHAQKVKGEKFVLVEITKQPEKYSPPEGKVIEVLGKHMAPGMETDVAIRSHNIPHEWPASVTAETDELNPEPSEADKKSRVDIRHLPLVTIDGEDARDFDDAVYCEATKSGGWKLYVAIADVSHYVKPNKPLDKEARKRGTSVYFPSRVVPMLPEALSNGLCSLKPDVDRLCMVCEINISKQGKISKYQFYEGVMHSHARLTYTKVGKILDAENPDANLRKQYKKLVPHLEELHRLYECLHAKRKQRGAIEFESQETRIIFGKDKKIEAIVPVKRNDAHKLIEECMLAANVAAAQFLEKHKIPALYRVHDIPRSEKLENVRQYLSELDLDLGGGDTPSPNDYRELLQSIKDRPDYLVIQTMLLRSMNQANYQAENRGHFGLAYDAYTHFTSPIRRYPDLMVHRAIRGFIKSGEESTNILRPKNHRKGRIKHYPYSLDELIIIGEHSSLTERRADDASRDVEAWLKCEFLQERVGEQHQGIITAVTSFGFFVELKDIYVEGLVHLKNMKDDYYVFDVSLQRLVGERYKNIFQLGDSVEVTVASVNLDERKIDFELAEHKPRMPRKRKASKSKASKNKKATKGRTSTKGKRTKYDKKVDTKKTKKKTSSKKRKPKKR